MTVIEQIIDELSDSEKSLTNPLLKTKVLASRIGNQDLMAWTNRELSGYNDEDLPTYRIGIADIICTLQQGYTIQENVPLPIMVFEKDFIAELMKFKFNDSIKTLEIQESENKNRILEKVFGPDMCAFMTNKAIKSGQRFAITSLSIRIHVSQITQVLSGVRAKLLDFILQVENEFPNLDDIIKNKLIMKESVNEKIEQIYHQTIINTSGFGNTITAGEKNSVKSTISINQGSLSDLRRELEKHSLPSENIEEIIDLVQVEEPDKESNKFGEKVNLWIQKMISKTLDGTWQIGTGTAGGVLVELIKNYYGI